MALVPQAGQRGQQAAHAVGRKGGGAVCEGGWGQRGCGRVCWHGICAGFCSAAVVAAREPCKEHQTASSGRCANLWPPTKKGGVLPG